MMLPTGINKITRIESMGIGQFNRCFACNDLTNFCAKAYCLRPTSPHDTSGWVCEDCIANNPDVVLAMLAGGA